jgi:lincosamide nucleotidyltransferase B/F
MHQLRLIERVRHVCRHDDRLDAALMYGSFAQGTGDAHSDIEFWLFFAAHRRHEVDPATWCGEVAPVRLLVRNEFGAHVAFFPPLIRGEFHFASTDDLAAVRAWPARGAPVDHMIVVDRAGRLRRVLAALPERATAAGDWAEAEDLCGRFANWLLLAHHVAARGEVLRALDALGQVQRHLLWLARLAEGNTAHWLTPSRRAEGELTRATLDRLAGTQATADRDSVRRAVRAAWRLGRDLWTALATLHGRSMPADLFEELDAGLGG